MLAHKFIVKVGLLSLVFLSPYPVGVFAQDRPDHTAHQEPAATAKSSRTDLQEVDYGRLPITFEENEGQAGSGVRFLARPSGELVLLEDQQAVLVAGVPAGKNKMTGKAMRFTKVRVKFSGANKRPTVVPMELQTSVSNYLLGNDPAKWHTRLKQYAKVAYKELYPGIDLVFYGNQRHLEHDFVVAPNADYRQIALRISSGGKLRMEADGSVHAGAEGGEIIFSRPKIYQHKGGQEVLVSGGFQLKNAHELGFRIGSYDKSEPLIIDPVLSYSTYIAGSQGDLATAIATDQDGSAYVTGLTFSADFPLVGAWQSNCKNCQGAADVFVTKVNPSGTGLVFSTFLGGSNYDQGNSIAVDSAGNVVVGGNTSSPDFPTKNPLLTAFPVNQTEGFITSLSADGSALNFSTFVGGNGGASVAGVTTDGQNQVYATGGTDSSDFPVTPATNVIGVAPAYPLDDLFVIKLNPAGQIVFATTIGPDPQQQQFNNIFVPASGTNIVVDAEHNIYLAGAASQGFPVTPGAWQTNYIGPPPDCGSCTMAFAAKMKPDGSGFTYATYLGGSGGDQVAGLAVDDTGNAFLLGNTSSTDFPVTAGAFSATPALAFVTKLNASGSALLYSTYLGGTPSFGGGFSLARGIAINAGGEAYVTGFTNSPDFPLKNPIQTVIPPDPFGGGGITTYVTKFNAAGNQILFSTLFSGSVGTQAAGIVLGPTNGPESVIVTGVAFGPDLPTTPGAFQTTVAPAPPNSEVSHAFVTKFDLATAAPAVCLSQSALFFSATVNTDSYPTPLTVTNCGNATLEISPVGVTGPFKETDTCQAAVAPGGSCTISVIFHPTEHGQVTGSLTLSSNVPLKPMTIAMQGQGVAAQVQFSTNPMQLGDQLVGHKGTAAPLFVFNPGDDFLQISSVKVSGHDFAVDASECTQEWVSPNNGICVILVTFKPQAAGLQTATLTMVDNAPDSPQSITIQGTGLTSYTLPAVQTVTPLALQQNQPNQTLTVSGSGFFPTSHIRINDNNLPTTYTSESFLTATVPTQYLQQLGDIRVDVFTPPPGGGSSNETIVTRYQILPIGANALVYEPVSRKLLASIGSNAPENANTIARINPNAEKVETYIPVGNNPNALGLSEWSKFLYVGLDGDHAIREIDLGKDTVTPAVALPNDDLLGIPTTAFQIQAVPGKPENDVVVSLRRQASPPEAGVSLIRNGKLESTLPSDGNPEVATDSICFLSDPTTFYGGVGNFLLELAIQDHVTLSVKPTPPTPAGFNGMFVCDGKYIYGYNGSVTNPVTSETIGNYALPLGVFGTSIVVDSSVKKTFIATFGQNGVTAFDQKTFAQVGAVPLPPNVSEPYSLVRWGAEGFAFLSYNFATSSGDLVLMKSGAADPARATSTVPRVQSLHPNIAAGYSNFVLTVTGRNYVPGSVVRWNGADRTTVFISSTELQADIPSTDVEKVVPVEVTVVNPPPGSGVSNVAHYQFKQ